MLSELSRLIRTQYSCIILEFFGKNIRIKSALNQSCLEFCMNDFIFRLVQFLRIKNFILGVLARTRNYS